MGLFTSSALLLKIYLWSDFLKAEQMLEVRKCPVSNDGSLRLHVVILSLYCAVKWFIRPSCKILLMFFPLTSVVTCLVTDTRD